MQLIPKIAYPDDEKPKLVLLENLFREWHQHFANPDSGLEREVADGMVFDRFYPHYFRQNKRILFIGREALEIADLIYLRCFMNAIAAKKNASAISLSISTSFTPG